MSAALTMVGALKYVSTLPALSDAAVGPDSHSKWMEGLVQVLMILFVMFLATYHACMHVCMCLLHSP